MMPVTLVRLTQRDQQVNTSFEDKGCATPGHHSVNHQTTSLILLSVGQLYLAWTDLHRYRVENAT